MKPRSLFVLVLLSLSPGPAASQDTARLYQEACEGGELAACNVFGLMNEAGEGVPQDLPRAVALFQRACEGGLLIGCTHLGLMYESGTGVPRNLARAVGLYQVACEGGELLGCSSIRGVGQVGVDALANQFFKTGRVGNAETGEPLSDAIIEVPDLGVQVISGAAGRFALAGLLPPGRYPLSAERAGYERLDGELVVPGNPEFLVLMTPAYLVDPLAQGGVSGRVTEEGRERGLTAVDITVLGQTPVRALSNNRGRFNLRGLQPGLTEIRFTRLGYAPRTATLIVQPGRTVELAATMSTRPIELEPITVVVRSRFLVQSGFYRRAERAFGRQFTRDDLEKIDPFMTSDVLRRVPGIHLQFDALNPDVVVATSRRGTSFSRGRCVLPVYVDDVRQWEFDLNQIPAEWIEAMEVYQGIGTPAQYNRDGCGAVLIWTQRGR